MERKNEISLVNKAKRGSKEAFETLESVNRPKIQGLLRAFLINQSDIEEIYQISIIKAWRKIKKFKADSSFSTWLTRIALNAAKDNIRKNRRKLINLGDFQEDSKHSSRDGKVMSENVILDYYGRNKTLMNGGFRNLELKDNSAMIKGALNGIPPQHKEILLMSVLGGLSYKEISVKLKIPLGTVMSRLYYAKMHARKILNRTSEFQL
jgi:RNA polymerase sigma-70 factor (ECF subfamily)